MVRLDAPRPVMTRFPVVSLMDIDEVSRTMLLASDDENVTVSSPGLLAA